MPSFATTQFGSHRALPGFELNICQGRAIFPGFTFRAGLSSSGQSRDLFRGSASAGIFRASAGMSYGVHIGICGPAWATAFRVSGNFDSNQATLDLQPVVARLGGADAWTGGFFAGASLSMGLSLGVDMYLPYVKTKRWGIKIGFKWTGVFGVSGGVNIDLIELMLKAVSDQQRPKAPEKAAADTSFPGKGSSLNIIGSGNDVLNNGGEIVPSWTVMVNLINFIPYINTLNWQMSAYGTGLSFGPTFTVGFPIKFDMTHFAINSGGVTGRFRMQGGRPGGRLVSSNVDNTLNPGTNQAVARIRWTLGMSFRIGVAAGVSVLWVISFGVSIDFPLANLIPFLQFGGVNFSGDLTSSVGSTDPFWGVLAGGGDCGCGETAVAETPRFVFGALESARA
jgi:hypothetical protein